MKTLFLNKHQCSHDSKIRFICELLVKYDVLNTSFINKDGLTVVKVEKDGPVIPITTKERCFYSSGKLANFGLFGVNLSIFHQINLLKPYRPSKGGLQNQVTRLKPLEVLWGF